MTDDVDPTLPDRLDTWPHLVRIELIWTLAAMVILTVWSILVDAPLESPANPTLTPDPSKAPWYFLGLQELLVYFDPWIAGVAFPILIVLGLAAIPYVDVNPRGSGYYGIQERPFAIAVFLFGFLGLWVLPILIGTFCRGPGWLWYWPWEAWDVPKTGSLPNRNLSDLFGVAGGSLAFVIGAVAVGGWYGIAGLYYLKKRTSRGMVALGFSRFAIVAFLLMTMLGIPVKMALRLGLSVKYVWVTPWFNI
ncbi:MAG: cytochrome C [Deltaproteobacteria bacterium]|nr:cytochrome C [Deltaproteobacteria bacterium]